MKILITGARSGISYQVAIKLARKGHFVYLTTHTNEQAISLNKKLEEYNLKILCFKLDITNEQDRHLIDNLDLDVLINHAGIGVGGSVVEMDLDDVRKNFEVNVFSSFQLLQLAYQNMRKRKKEGKIFIMSSLASMVPLPFLGSYCASKAAISTLTISLKKELRSIHSKIQISLIEPGAYRTGFNQVMIDNKEKYLYPNSLFYQKRQEISKKQTKLFSIMEKKHLDSIVNKIVKQVEKKKSKFKIRAPFLQRVGAKLYLLFLR